MTTMMIIIIFCEQLSTATCKARSDASLATGLGNLTWRDGANITRRSPQARSQPTKGLMTFL